MKSPSFTNTQSDQHVARFEIHANDLSGLRKHLPAMRTTVEELSHSATRLELKGVKAFLAHPWYVLGALGDLHAAAVADLEQGRDFGAMVLAREGLRLAVDATYVLQDPAGDRAEGLLRRHVDAQRERFSHWQRALPDDIQAGHWLKRLDDICRQSPWYPRAPGWPSFIARAEAVDLHSWIHPLFSPAGDAGESATQQFMTVLECEYGPAAERDAAHAYRTARCMSDALYTETVALLLFAHALHQMAVVIDDPVAITVATSSKERMESVLSEHHALAEAHSDGERVYIGIRSGSPTASTHRR
jgi:hypothetical protein